MKSRRIYEVLLVVEASSDAAARRAANNAWDGANDTRGCEVIDSTARERLGDNSLRYPDWPDWPADGSLGFSVFHGDEAPDGPGLAQGGQQVVFGLDVDGSNWTVLDDGAGNLSCVAQDEDGSDLEGIEQLPGDPLDALAVVLGEASDGEVAALEITSPKCPDWRIVPVVASTIGAPAWLRINDWSWNNGEPADPEEHSDWKELEVGETDGLFPGGDRLVISGMLGNRVYVIDGDWGTEFRGLAETEDDALAMVADVFPD